MAGIRDVTFDLMSVLYRRVQDAEGLEQYIRDAEQGGDQELARFFRELIEEDQDRVERARVLLRDRQGGQGPVPPAPTRRGPGRAEERSLWDDDAKVDEASEESFPASDAPAY